MIFSTVTTLVIGNVISLGEIPVFISLENLCISQASM